MSGATPPRGLTKLQKALWKAILPLVELEATDMILFQQAIVSASYMLEAQELVAKEGLFVELDRNMGTGTLVTVREEHPALKVMERHQKLYLVMVDKLGWSPAARAKIKLEPPKDKAPSLKRDPFTTPPQLPPARKE